MPWADPGFEYPPEREFFCNTRDDSRTGDRGGGRVAPRESSMEEKLQEENEEKTAEDTRKRSGWNYLHTYFVRCARFSPFHRNWSPQPCPMAKSGSTTSDPTPLHKSTRFTQALSIVLPSKWKVLVDWRRESPLPVRFTHWSCTIDL